MFTGYSNTVFSNYYLRNMQIRAAGFPARSSGTAYRVMHFFKHGWDINLVVLVLQ